MNTYSHLFSLLLAGIGLFAMATSSTSAMVALQNEPTPVEITNSKLAPINMGLDATQHWLDKMQPGDARRAQTLLADLEKLATRFNRLPASDDADYQYVASRFQSLVDAIQAKAGEGNQAMDGESASGTAQEGDDAQPSAKPNPKIFTLSRQLDAIDEVLVENPAATPETDRQLNAKWEYATSLFNEIPASRHPDYLTVRERWQSLNDQFSGGDTAMTADPVELIAQLRVRYDKELPIPRAQKTMASRELTDEDVSYFIGGIEAFREKVAEDLPALRKAVAATERGSDLLSWLEKEAEAEIQKQTDKLVARLDDLIQRTLVDGQQLAELDLESNRYSFVTESVVANNEAKFARALRSIERATGIEEAFQLGARWSAQAPELESLRDTYRQRCSEALVVRELPEDIGDGDLGVIAREVLAQDKYGAGEALVLIVNAPQRPGDRITTRFFNDRLETVIREWVEFQVCTVEQVGDARVVYFNTLRKFSRGDATTPIDTWILADRFRKGTLADDVPLD